MTLRRGKLIADNPLTLGTPRALTREDLAILKEKRPAKPTVQRLRDPHHRLARFIAMGHNNTVAAQLSGYSIARVQMFQTDPAFVQLVSEYRGLVNESYKEAVDEYMALAVGNMIKAERQIAEHFDKADEEDELLPLSKLDTISQGRMDRFGYGKKQTNLNVNVDFAAQLEKARQRSGRVIDGVKPPSPPALPILRRA